MKLSVLLVIKKINNVTNIERKKFTTVEGETFRQISLSYKLSLK